MNYGNPATNNGTPTWAKFGRAPTAPTPTPIPTPVQATQPSGFMGGDGEWNWARFAEWAPYGILGNMGDMANRGLANMRSSQDTYDASRLNAINALSPGGTQALIDAFRQRAMAGANDQGRQTDAMLRSQGITGQGASSMLDAQNRAADATNSYDANLNSPEGQAQRFMQMMGLSSPEAAAPIMQLIQSLFGQASGRVQQNNAEHAQRASQSGLGGILGQFAGIASGMPLFKGGGSGGGDQYDWSGSGYGAGAIGRR